jgi:ribosomal protein S18 acetylase RimI-like enzyme
MIIEPASPADLPMIRVAYAHGRALQREAGSTVWPAFSDEAILDEVERGDLFRVIDADGALAGVFTVAYEDLAIWGDLERWSHLYLHRIARAPEWSGRGLMEAILSWATERCEAFGREGIRIDTWGENTPLISFYESRGFALVRRRRIGVDPRLPPHYHGGEFALLERPCPS